MENFIKKQNQLISQESKNVLDFFNKAYTHEEFIEVLNNDENNRDCLKLAEAIMLKRNRLGAFTNVDQLLEIQGVNAEVYSNIVSILIKKPTFSFENEKLEHVMWTHGTSLNVEHPAKFSSIIRKGNGTRIVGPVYEQGISGVSESFVHFAIPTPAFSSGNRLSIKSVLLNFSTSGHRDLHGFVIAGILEVHIWDGHQKITSHEMHLDGEQRFVRCSVPANHKIIWGIGVSVKIILFASVHDLMWIEFASAGAEFVNRTDSVIAADA